jgi:hypothetical protein
MARLHNIYFAKVTGMCLLAMVASSCANKAITPEIIIKDIVPDVSYVPDKPDFVAKGTSVKLRDGLELSLFVDDTAAKTSWAPSGKTLPQYVGLTPINDFDNKSLTQHPPGVTNRAFTAVVPRHFGQGVSGTFRVVDHPEMNGLAGVGWHGLDKSAFVTISFFHNFRLPMNLRSLDVMFGLSDEPWKTAGTYYTDGGKHMGVDFKPRILNTARDGIVVEPTIPSDVYKSAYRIILFDSKGAAFTSIPDSGLYLYVNRGHQKTIQRVELQTRPYTWVEYKNVKMNPDSGLKS